VIGWWMTCILAIYGLCTILIQLLKRWNKYYANLEVMHVQLLLHNSESSLEGVVRSLVQLSLLEGRPLHLIVYDYGSTDNTTKILTTIQKTNPFLFEQIHRGSFRRPQLQWVNAEHISTPPLTIDLRQGA
jgi:hypothetical protein